MGIYIDMPGSIMLLFSCFSVDFFFWLVLVHVHLGPWVSHLWICSMHFKKHRSFDLYWSVPAPMHMSVSYDLPLSAYGCARWPIRIHLHMMNGLLLSMLNFCYPCLFTCTLGIRATTSWVWLLYGVGRKDQSGGTLWLQSIPVEKWTLCHDGGRRKYGMMTVNFSKVFNSVLESARNISITACV